PGSPDPRALKAGPEAGTETGHRDPGPAGAEGAAMAGFTIPYRHAGQVRAIGYPAVERRLEAARVTFEALLGRAAGFLPVLRSFAGPPPLPRWDQDWFPRLDGALAYCLARSLRPRRIVEIGSGHSTRFL